jgi:hypothetical protein
MLSELDGEPIVWQHEFRDIGFLSEYLRVSKFFIVRTNLKVVYVLTNKRALILEVKGQQKVVLGQCQLEGVTASVMNRRDESSATRTSSSEVVGTVTRGVGDVLFFGQGQLKLRFDGVPSPDEVVGLLGAVAKQQTVSPIKEGAPAMDLVAEKQVWNSGPLVATIQFGEGGGWRSALHRKMIKIQYVLTNKRAYITGTGGEGKIEGAYGLSHPKILHEKLVVAKDWNGGIIAQCDLAQAEPVIVNRKQTDKIGEAFVKSIGDIDFLVGGRVSLSFHDIEDPDGIIALIRQIRT